MTVLSAFVMAMHTCRRIDHRHIKNLMGKLRVDDPKQFEQAFSQYNKNIVSKREYEQLKSHYYKS